MARLYVQKLYIVNRYKYTRHRTSKYLITIQKWYVCVWVRSLYAIDLFVSKAGSAADWLTLYLTPNATTVAGASNNSKFTFWLVY
jgi:hypothetical protein